MNIVPICEVISCQDRWIGNSDNIAPLCVIIRIGEAGPVLTFSKYVYLSGVRIGCGAEQVLMLSHYV